MEHPETAGEKLNLQLWDTAGQEDFKQVSRRDWSTLVLYSCIQTTYKDLPIKGRHPTNKSV